MPTTVVNTNAGIAEIASLMGSGLGGVLFEEVALGQGTAAPAATDTTLGSEVVSGGGERKTGANVTVSLATENVTNDTILFNTSWAFTASFSISEFGVFNDPAAGDMWFRGRFEDGVGAVAPINVQPADTLEAFIYVTATDEASDAFKVVTSAGLAELNRLLVDDVTAGNDISSIGIGADNGTLLPLAATNTALGDEFVALDGFTLARQEEIAGPTVALDTVNVANDTVKVTSQWEVTAPDSTVDVEEVGIFNNLAESAGTLFSRHLFTNGTLTLHGNDTAFPTLSRGSRLTMNFRLTNK